MKRIQKKNYLNYTTNFLLKLDFLRSVVVRDISFLVEKNVTTNLSPQQSFLIKYSEQITCYFLNEKHCISVQRQVLQMLLLSVWVTLTAPRFFLTNFL